MINGPPKNRGKRRRRRKHLIRGTSNTATSSNLDVDESPSEQLPTHSYLPKVNEEFLNEDAEIETAMLVKHMTKDNELELKKDREIEFFTNSLVHPPRELNEDDDNDNQAQRHKEESIYVLPTPSSIRTGYPYPDDGPQLASSYLNEDSENVVEPFASVIITFNEDELFLPELSMPKKLTDVENPINPNRNRIAEGHYVHQKPNILQINRSQLINRMIESNCKVYFNEANQEIHRIFEFISNHRLIKLECAQKFQPIYYTPTSVNCILHGEYILQDKLLKIHINNLTFDKHPTFNAEQKLARELETLYEEYMSRKLSEVVVNIEKKINVLRQLLNTTSKFNSQRSKELFTESGGRGLVYRNELRDLRSRLHREQKIDRDIIKNVLHKWSALKKERDRQSAKTSVKLTIRNHEVDIEQDKLDWHYHFNLEFNEIFNESMNFYRAERRRQKELIKKMSKTDQTDFESLPKLQRPDVDQIRQQLYDIYSNSMRPPGEEIIDFELHKDNVVYPNTIKDLPKYVIRLLLDGKELDKAETTRLNAAGQVYINANFTIKFITKIPDKIKLQIYEKNSLNVEKKITEIFPPIPYEKEVFNATSLIQMNFSSETELYSGKVGCRIGWSESTINPNTVQTSMSLTSIKSCAVEPKMRQILKKWYSEELIDPMDPDNHALISTIESPMNSTVKPLFDGLTTAQHKHVFRLNEDSHTFCPVEKFNDNKRIEMLNARFNSDLKLKDCKLIPHTEIEIEIPANLKIFEDMLWIDPIDVQRYQGKQYLKHVYDIITNHCEVINRNYVHRDLLIGDTPPTINGALEAFSNIFSPRRPLNPNRKSFFGGRRTNFREADNINRFNIIVNVVRASGIPFRNQNERTGNRRASLASAVKNLHLHSNIRPFVTATFKDKTLRTSTVDGSSPTWNEQMVILINEDINHIKDSLWIHMYDEIIEDLPSNDELMPGTEIYQKISSHYLGELVIPFSTIYTSQRIEGTFQMSTPIILLGYTKPTVNVSDHDANGSIEIRQSILISLLISIEPIIDIIHFSTSHLECIELNRIKNHIEIWLNELREEFPQRAQDPLVSLANGKRVSITRLIGPIDIPFDRNEVSEYLIRRFVSMIPVRPHKNVCTKLNGIWLTNDQILNILITSPKDLGVLLTCYYLSLEFTAYLVMGFAIPYGDTTFVLTKENGQHFLIDPHSGKKCISRDTFCPLTKIYCVVNQKNVWANIQREHRVFMQNFDLNQSTEWRPLFTKSLPAPNDLVHDISLTYTDSLDSENLRKLIEMKLMKKITGWRSVQKTVWNKRFRKQLIQILKELEEDQSFEYEQKSFTDKLNADLLSKYKVSGYPINMPYVSIARIVERVEAIGIHFNSDSKVEFSLAVHIQSYPMNIFSVWIFLLALIPY